ncbi:MAG: 1-(5-phosphoribosyl)-5-[(5-phosphoribosylamino)methylideneamino]imidazole-4-carboxamide isomerase [Opitutales bacterium]
MNIYPAIDIKDGKCVRLKQGLANEQTVYFNNPVDAAKNFADADSKWIHIVNLDGAFDSKTSVLDIVEEIATLGMKIQLGGAMRDLDSVKRAFDAGVERAIIGTKACTNPEFAQELISLYGEKIAIGIDAKNGYVAINGWVEVSQRKALDFAKDLSQMGLSTIIYTDIDTDGMLTGPNLKAQEEMLKAVPNTNIIASGGISCAKDIYNLADLKKLYPNLDGAIIGKAIYEAKISFAELKTMNSMA